jgi:hypothetical protein
MFKELYPTAILKDFNDYDFLYHDKKIEIKSKILNTTHSDEHEFAVLNCEQACDFYVFCSNGTNIIVRKACKVRKTRKRQ